MSLKPATKIFECPKYLIFAGDEYYPGGGWHDLYGATNSFEDAQKIYYDIVDKSKNIYQPENLDLSENYDQIKNDIGGYDWVHVVDTANNIIILESQYQRGY